MDLRKGSKTSLLQQLNTTHGLVVGVVSSWQFSLPAVLTDDPSGLNTRIKLTALADNTYGKSRSFYFNRLDLADVQRNYPANPTQKLTGPTSVHGCFPYLLKCTGILFDQTDLKDLPLVDNGDGTWKIPLEAADTSILWHGTCQLNSGDLPPITVAIPQPYFDWS